MTNRLQTARYKDLNLPKGGGYPSEIGSLINGKRTTDVGSNWSVVYPGSGETIGTVTSASKAQVEQAVESAKSAFEIGEWRKMPLERRQNIFQKIADLLVQNTDELAALQALETGIPYSQFHGFHVLRSAQNFRFFASAAATLSGQTFQQTGRYFSASLYDPVGTALIIAPWNAPLVLASMKAAACLIMGNSCVIKASEYTPYSVLRLVEIMIDAGVPKDVVHLINGFGHTVGDQLARHNDIQAISFVGGTETGKLITKSASTNLKKVSLELGGKSAAIILKDTDLDAAIDGTLLGGFAGNGEQCLSGSRILVERDIADEFISRYVARVKNIKVGDPFNTKTELGPLAFAAHKKRFLEYIDIAKSEGAEILCGAEALATDGHYVNPVVALAGANSFRICQEEIFGPFVSIVIVDDLDEAIRLANDSEFGLAAYIWTRDIASMMRVTKEVQAGTIWVNTPMTRDLRAPFGGYKLSGIGRDGLVGSLELFTQQKTMMIPTGDLYIPKLGELKS